MIIYCEKSLSAENVIGAFIGSIYLPMVKVHFTMIFITTLELCTKNHTILISFNYASDGCKVNIFFINGTNKNICRL